MEDKIKKKLDEVLDKQLNEIIKKDALDEEDIAKLTELYKMRIEEKKMTVDLIKIGMQTTTAITTLLAYNAWFIKGLKFEEIGSIGSPIVKNLISKLTPKK